MIGKYNRMFFFVWISACETNVLTYVNETGEFRNKAYELIEICNWRRLFSIKNWRKIHIVWTKSYHRMSQNTCQAKLFSKWKIIPESYVRGKKNDRRTWGVKVCDEIYDCKIFSHRPIQPNGEILVNDYHSH